jgi:hypothetical protein
MTEIVDQSEDDFYEIKGTKHRILVDNYPMIATPLLILSSLLICGLNPKNPFLIIIIKDFNI